MPLNALRRFQMLNGITYQKCTILVAIGFPGLLFSVVFFLNLFMWAKGATNAIPFLSMFTVVLLWFAVSVPLVFMGAYYGFKKDKITFPVAVSSIPRQIPPQQWYFKSWVVYTIGGVLPFGAVFVELYFILASVWMDQYYYVFGFLLLVFGLLIVTCAEIAIVLVYFQLCAEDYRWWWRSALVPGASGVYVFVYSIYYLATKLDIDDSTSQFLYVGYMFLVSFLFFLLTGAVGHLSTLWFTRKIYGAIKVD
jgi:transmembrane 9 superfamily member 2/4